MKKLFKGWQKNHIKVFLGTSFVFILVYILSRIFTLQNDKINYFNDFYAFYVGSKVFWSGGNLYDLQGDFKRTAELLNTHFLMGSGYSYPPLLAVIFFPFLLLSPTLAAEIWAIINIVLYTIFSYLILKKYLHISSKKFVLLTVFLFTFAPAVHSILNGQANMLLLFAMYFYLFSKSPFALMIASYLKVYPGIFILKELIEKSYRFVGKYIAWCVGMLVFLFIFTKDQVMYYFLKVLPSLNNSFDPYHTNQSINGFVSRVFEIFTIPQSYFSTTLMVISVIVLGSLILYTLRHNQKKYIIALIWLGTMTLLAGKNSFWNFTPCVFIGIYLIEHFEKLSRTQKILFVISIILSNVLGQGLWIYSQTFLLGSTSGSKLIYFLSHSIGTIYLVIQLYLLKVFSTQLSSKSS